jgi:hypothetical protein
MVVVKGETSRLRGIASRDGERPSAMREGRKSFTLGELQFESGGREGFEPSTKRLKVTCCNH